MPRRDGTGPLGMGRVAGRGMGFCNLAKDQKDLLKEEKAILENRLNLIKNQLNTLQDDK